MSKKQDGVKAGKDCDSVFFIAGTVRAKNTQDNLAENESTDILQGY